jgi:hypothetical protein
VEGLGEQGLNIKKTIDVLVYASVALGVVLLFVAGPLVPSWLLASLAAGEAAYAACAVAVAKGHRRAYYVIIVLALLVLAVSLPQPDHYAFATDGEIGAFLIFGAGSVLQVCLLILIPVYLRRTRK